MPQTPPIKAEVTIQVLADGGYVVNGMCLSGATSPEGQQIPSDRFMRARENMNDAIEDVRTFLARNSNLAVVT